MVSGTIKVAGRNETNKIKDLRSVEREHCTACYARAGIRSQKNISPGIIVRSADNAKRVCGEHDKVTGLRVSRTLTQNFPHARLVTMAGVGHAPHTERPDNFAAHVRDFMNERR